MVLRLNNEGDSVFDQIEEFAHDQALLKPILKESREDREEIKRLTARIAELELLIDPPVCRLQFPDGSVPGNAKEAAEGWKRRHDEVRGSMLRYETRCLQMAAALYSFIHGKRPNGASVDLQTNLDEARRLTND